MTESGNGGNRAVPYVCPFCGEEDLRPAEGGCWHCSSCLRLFSLAFHGLSAVTSPHPEPAPAALPNDPTTPGSTR